MEIKICDKRRIVEVWLTNAEKSDSAVQERLKTIYEEYKAKKYIVAVFQSGDGDLHEYTSALLRYNRKRAAEREKTE
jgi:hypothetical protein